MLANIKQEIKANLNPLVGDIVGDVLKLIRQEIELAKFEVREEIQKTLRISSLMIVASIIGAIALAFLSMASVNLLMLSFVALPLWGAYAIVGIALAIVAGGVAIYARHTTSG